MVNRREYAQASSERHGGDDRAAGRALASLPANLAPLAGLTAFTLAALLAIAGCAPRLVPARTGPAIRMEAQAWDFGTLARGEKASTDVAISSVGTDSLRVSLFPTCDCLTAAVDIATIAPGASTMLHLSLVAPEVKHRMTKTLFIDSNDPAQPRITFSVTGTVAQGDDPNMVVAPNPLAIQGSGPEAGSDATHTASASRSAPLRLANTGRRDLVVKAIRCFGCETAQDGTTVKPGEEVILEIEIIPGWSGARWIEIESNDPVFPLKKISVVDLD